MKVVLQRVREAGVRVDNEEIARIGSGFLALVGIGREDGQEDIDLLANKIANLRVFEDDEGKMNRSILEVGGEVLAVSQFTLYADCRKGRRPSFINAAPPEEANSLFERFVEALRALSLPVQTGRFQAMMDVRLVNSGPVTISLDSKELLGTTRRGNPRENS